MIAAECGDDEMKNDAQNPSPDSVLQSASFE